MVVVVMVVLVVGMVLSVVVVVVVVSAVCCLDMTMMFLLLLLLPPSSSPSPGGIRTPSFITGPLLPPSLHGTTYSGLFHMVDWSPTMMELAGIMIEEEEVVGGGMDGVSHAMSLLGE